MPNISKMKKYHHNWHPCKVGIAGCCTKQIRKGIDDDSDELNASITMTIDRTVSKLSGLIGPLLRALFWVEKNATRIVNRVTLIGGIELANGRLIFRAI